MIASLSALALVASAPAPDRCRALLLSGASVRPVAKARAVGVGDLVRLRDFGQMGAGYGDEALFSVSPDGRRVALSLRRADPDTNEYCIGLVIVDLTTRVSRLVDLGGELIRPTYAHSKILGGFPMGVPAVVTPDWSTDGQWLLFLKRQAGLTQAWRVRVDGEGVEQLTREPQDVTAAVWSGDGKGIVYQTDADHFAAEKAIDVEAREGWLYDDRSSPISTPRPYPRPSDPSTQVRALDLLTRSALSVQSSDRERLEERQNSSLRTNSSAAGGRASIAVRPTDPTAYLSPRRIEVTDGGKNYECHHQACGRVVGYWMEASGRSALFMSRSGWGRGSLRFHRWFWRSGQVVPLFETSDLLMGCRLLDTELLCARETATTPRRLEMIDPVTGRTKSIFNPNPDYDRLDRGRVERLKLTGENGSQTFADLMLPPDFRPGRRYPMVVVQYESRGFLRGGTGEEYPIPALASAGMIVLSFQRPPDIATTVRPSPTNIDDYIRIDMKGWADRRNVHAALMDGVGQVLRKGIIDPSRVGITGVSDGIGTTAFALLNSSIFSVAALNGCCEEPINMMALQGPEWSRKMSVAGVPGLTSPDSAFWRDFSVAQNAERVKAPLLVQSPDREFILSLVTLQSLRETGLPVELHVFPGEFHIKWQPAHKRAIYDRALRWFQFWFDLPASADQAPPPVGERERWVAMREKAGKARRLVDRPMTYP